MPDLADLPFHVLRPYWLIAFLPLGLVLALVMRQQREDGRWGAVIAPHLLKHLIVRPDSAWGLKPIHLIAAGTGLAIIALSGPTWRREVPPFVEDKGSLMIALAVTPSMMQRDVPPSRLERAKQKIRDLLAARGRARTGLIAFAGTAHLVMPLTDDPTVLEPFLAALAPDVMPNQGKNATAAVALAAESLSAETVPGTILVVTDDRDGEDFGAMQRTAARNSALILAVAPDDGERNDWRSSGGAVVRVSVDGSDIRALERRIETHFQAAQGDAFGAQWLDEGYWLLLPASLLCLAWFRRGTTLPWAIALIVLSAATTAKAEEASWFRALWLTPDQQGRIAFERGDYAGAAKLFADPMWRGIAAYRAYDFLAAAQAFQQIETPEGRFAFGNAEAQNHAYQKAVKAYDDVLAIQPDNVAAKTNRAIVVAALKRQDEERLKKEKEQSPPDLPPDDMTVDPNQHDGKRIRVTAEDVTTAAAADAWMREVQTKPADFLKLKFSIQAAMSLSPRERSP